VARPQARRLFLASRDFDRFCAANRAGTFVPGSDYSAKTRGRLLAQLWKQEDRVMLGWVVTFLIIALIAGILGFGGVAGASIEIAKIIFFIAVVLFLVSAIVGLARGRTQV